MTCSPLRQQVRGSSPSQLPDWPALPSPLNQACVRPCVHSPSLGLKTVCLRSWLGSWRGKGRRTFGRRCPSGPKASVGRWGGVAAALSRGRGLGLSPGGRHLWLLRGRNGTEDQCWGQQSPLSCWRHGGRQRHTALFCWALWHKCGTGTDSVEVEGAHDCSEPMAPCWLPPAAFHSGPPAGLTWELGSPVGAGQVSSPRKDVLLDGADPACLQLLAPATQIT